VRVVIAPAAGATTHQSIPATVPANAIATAMPIVAPISAGDG
jgi:hypothetical protein